MLWVVLLLCTAAYAHPYGPIFMPPSPSWADFGTSTSDGVRSEYRSLSGYGNNVENPEWGTILSPYVRIQTPPAFFSGPTDPNDPASPLSDPMDGIDWSLPNPRLVSHKLFDAAGIDTPNVILLNQLHLNWGHFILTDIINSQHSPLVRVPGTFVKLPIPDEDWHQDESWGADNPPDGTVECESNGGSVCEKSSPNHWMFLYRHFAFPGTGAGTSNPKTGYSDQSAWLDLSSIYGDPSQPQQFYGLFSMNPWFDVDEDGNMLNWGKFNFGVAGYDVGPLLMPRAGSAGWMAGGDFRINKTPALRILCLTFMKEHNRLIDEFRLIHPGWSNETLFHEARRLNIAFYQSISFREYLAAAAGKPADPYTGYKPDVSPGIDHTFVHVAFRYGHTALPTEIPLLDDDLNSCPYGKLFWNNFYFPSLWATPDEENPYYDPETDTNTTTVRKVHDYESMIRGLGNSLAGKVDLNFVDSIRNHFGQQGGPRHGEDLISADIFRSRDMGIPLYNDAREAMGLGRVSDFSDITQNKVYQGLLKELYGTVDRIDTYVGAMAEDHPDSQEMGPFNTYSIREQFTRFRDSDRFFFENPEMFTPEEIELVHSTKLKDIIMRNWNIDENALPTNPFFLNERQLVAFKPDTVFPAPIDHPKGYPWANRNLTDVYKLYWAIDRFVEPREITVQIIVQTNGWAGIGFKPDQKGSMKGADIVLCRIFEDVPECRDSKAFDVGEPVLDTNDGGTNGLWDVNVKRENGILHAMFTRYLSNEEDPDHDNSIGDEDMRIIFAFNPNTNALLYHGPTRNPDVVINFESEYRGPPVQVSISQGVLIILYILCAIGVTLAIIYSVLVITKGEYFRFQTPEFCILVNFGAILGYISVLLILPDSQTDGTCKAHLWLFGMSFWIVFVGFFTKVLRVYYIVKRSEQTMEVTTLPFYYLFIPLTIFLLAEMVMNICWDTLVPPDLDIEYNEDDNTYVQFCAGNKWFWLGSVIWRACFLGLGVILAVETKHMPQELNWSKEIGAVIYTLAIILGIGIPIGFFVGSASTMVVILKGLTICVAYITVTTIVHGDSLTRILTGDGPAEQTKYGTHGVSRTKTSASTA